MYASGLSYSRLRPTYDDKERTIGPTTYGWHTSLWPDRTASSATTRNNVNSNRDSGSMASSQQQSGTPARRNRYTRASTTSVTQLLSDSCSSLLQRLTTRVRGPSATFERSTQKSATTANIPSLHSSNNTSSTVPSSLGTTSKNKFEDKYTYVLDRIYGRRRDHEKTLEPSVGRTLTKSATTSNVLLSEKAYPYVSNNVPYREKTPYRNETRVPQHHYYQHHHVPVEYPEPPYTYLNRDSVYRLRHRSNHSELRPRRSSKPQRTGKSEASEGKSSITKLHPVEIPLTDDGPVPVHAPTTKTTVAVPAVVSDDETTPTPGGAASPDALSEREAKRKEIQSLIMKYSALDEAYNRSNATAAPTSAAAAIAQKYYPRLTATAVSNGRV